MTFHKDFFHDAISQIRKDGYKKTIIVGGPHPTTSYEEVLKDKNIDVCVVGEGEKTLEEIVAKLIKNKGKKLNISQLNDIDGIAYNQENHEKFSPIEKIEKVISNLATERP